MPTKGVILANTDVSPGVRSLGGDVPGELLPIGNKPILHYALEGMQRGGIEDVAIVTSERSTDAIEDAVGDGAPWGMRVVYLPQRKSADVPAALLAADSFVDGDAFVVEEGHGLLRDDLGEIVHGLGQLHADAMLLVQRAGRNAPAVETGVPGSSMRLAGAHAFGPDFMRRAHRRLREARGGLSLLIEDLRRDGARVELRLVRDWHTFVGDVKDLLEMNRVVLDELEDAPLPSRLTDCDISGRVAIDPTARVESSVIRGPAVIGAGATLVDAYVGPYTAIGRNVRVEGAEVEGSIVLAGARILHVGARVEASFVGHDAKVFRDFSLPKALRLCIGDGAEVGLR